MKKTLSLSLAEIAYYEINQGSQETIIFVHGNSSSRKSFLNQKRENIFNKRLIFIDLPGHGDSGPIDNYSLPVISKLLSEFIIKLKINNFMLVGHSFGGHVVLHALKDIDPKGILIFGTPPISSSFKPSSFLDNKNSHLLFSRSAEESSLAEFFNELGYSELTSQAVDDYLKTDSKFRTDLLESIGKLEYLNEVMLLKQYEGLKGIIYSLRDSIINNEYTKQCIFENNIATEELVLNSSHCPHIENSDSFNAVLKHFSERVFLRNYLKAETQSAMVNY